MAKKKHTESPFENVFGEVHSHYVMWRDDNDTRRTRKNGWNDITDAYWGKLPSDWPYISRTVDPRIRTSLIEKNARLMNTKLRGRLVPREGGDVLKARINNAILEFQWDSANYGGSMLSKWASMDLDTRLYGSKFGLVTWRYCEYEGKVEFDGNEFTTLDLRDCGMDPKAKHIRDAKWFQHRSWEYVEDLEKANMNAKAGEIYPGLPALKEKIKQNSDRRDVEYESRLLTNKGLDDRVGEDKVFPVVEVVTEYRADRWITFSPKYRVILRDIPNPFKHRKIPIVQLKYYPFSDDNIGESEVEPVLPLWKAIQATVCGYLDNMNIHMRPPVKIIEGQARIETIVYGPEAQWLVNRQDAVQEMQGNGEAMRYFETTYGAMVNAFNNAMGDLSQGTSSMDPFNSDKTATEVKQTAKQQNIRDQKNQTDLSEALQDMMMMWLSNNQQFLFADPTKQEYVLRIVGSDLFEYFKRAGLDEMEVDDTDMQQLAEMITVQDGQVNDYDIQEYISAVEKPKYPVIENPEEKDPEQIRLKPKMRVSDMGDAAELSVVPEDLTGMYDYIPDVKSMASGADADLIQARQRAIELLTTNQAVLGMLQQEGVKPVIKDLLISSLEDTGLKDASRFFQQVSTQETTPGGASTPQAIQNTGMPGGAASPAQGRNIQQMVGSPNMPQPGGVLPQLPTA